MSHLKDFLMHDHSEFPVYNVDQIVQMEKFLEGLNFCNQSLLAIHQKLPREVRYVADMRRWIMTHGALKLNFLHRINPEKHILTATTLFREVAHTGQTSPNTVTSFLKEIENKGHILAIESSDRRNRAYHMSEFAERMFYHYLTINIASLDIIDSQNRSKLFTEDPRILTHLHPIFAQKMLSDTSYYLPPPSIAPLICTTIGISVLNEMTRNIDQSQIDDEHIEINLDSASIMAQRYGTSRGNISKLLKELADENHYGKSGKKTWISRQLLTDYFRWQACKLAHISSAYISAIRDREDEKKTLPSFAHYA
jgi:hypothetical protein